MVNIEANEQGKKVQRKKRINRRMKALLPDNFSALADDAARIEALRATLIEVCREILDK